jgi:hypothetical protein
VSDKVARIDGELSRGIERQLEGKMSKEKGIDNWGVY